MALPNLHVTCHDSGYGYTELGRETSCMRPAYCVAFRNSTMAPVQHGSLLQQSTRSLDRERSDGLSPSAQMVAVQYWLLSLWLLSLDRLLSSMQEQSNPVANSFVFSDRRRVSCNLDRMCGCQLSRRQSAAVLQGDSRQWSRHATFNYHAVVAIDPSTSHLTDACYRRSLHGCTR
jgi:hypothetical protein